MAYPKIDVHFQGVFVGHPFRYDDGIHHLLTDIDFAGMNLNECITFLERFTREKCEKLYYCLLEFEIRQGLRLIANEGHYAEFILTAYQCGVQLPMYIDHFGVYVAWMIEEEEEEDDENQKADLLDSNSVADLSRDLEDMIDFEDMHTPSKKTTGEKDNSDSGDEEEEPDFVYRDDDEPENVQTFYSDEVDWKDQHPVLGMRFENPKALKHMLCNYVVANGYQLFYKKNDNTRLLVFCCGGECSFRLWASWMSEEQSFQIKSLKDEHNCAQNFKLGPIVNYRWIGAHYKQEFLHKEKITVRVLKEDIRQKFGLDVSMGQCRRAKQYALSLVEGTIVEHYARLWSYAEEIRRSNPGSNVKLAVNSMPDGKTYFSRFYVCFDGLKMGWNEGCRRVLNLDGCFLNGFCSGQLLAAVGRDGNNHIFPVAWGVVCVENKENWKWFLENLIEDLNLGCGFGLTLMSDQHKGLLEVVKDVLPDAEHRQCARHILANFTKKFRGAQFEKIFWRACKASTENHFNAVMKELQEMNTAAHKHLMDRNPKTWSRAFFQTGRACDAYENGMAESFNSVIVSARHKPIITMLEEIRVWSMERIYKMSIKGQNFAQYKICPAISLLVDDLKKEQMFWQVLPCGPNQFEARNMGVSYTVDLDKKECTCRMWQLNGYGCVHSVATISFLNTSIEPYVDPLLLGTFFRNTYKYPILAMNGNDMWPTTNYIPPLPPMKRRMPGRPQVKRRRSASEGQIHKVSKAGKRLLCGNCKQPEHNKSTCTYVPTHIKPVKLNVKRKLRLDEASGSGINKEAAIEDGGVNKKQKVQGSTNGRKKGKNVGSISVGKKHGKKVHTQSTDGVEPQPQLQPQPQPQTTTTTTTTSKQWS